MNQPIDKAYAESVYVNETEAKRDPEVVRMVAAIHGGSQDLSAAIMALEKRLCLALRPSPPTADSVNAVRERLDAPLAIDLQAAADRIYGMLHALNDITQRLEV